MREQWLCGANEEMSDTKGINQLFELLGVDGASYECVASTHQTNVIACCPDDRDRNVWSEATEFARNFADEPLFVSAGPHRHNPEVTASRVSLFSHGGAAAFRYSSNFIDDALRQDGCGKCLGLATGHENALGALGNTPPSVSPIASRNGSVAWNSAVLFDLEWP